MIFCKINQELIDIIKKYAKGRIVVDCGAGEGLLGKLYPEEIIALDTNPEYLSRKVLPFDCTIFSFNKGHFPVFIRPCHSGFVGETLENNEEVIDIIYVGYKKNILIDIDIEDEFECIEIDGFIGEDEEKVYHIIMTNRDEAQTFYKISRKDHYGDTVITWALKGKAPWSDDKVCWINSMGGMTPDGEDTTILEEIIAEGFEDLDWKDTWMTNERHYDSGWLNRDGRWYPCSSQNHDTIAYYLLRSSVQELEDTGWCRVHSKDLWLCHVRVSAEQRNWLSQNGYKVEEWN